MKMRGKSLQNDNIDSIFNELISPHEREKKRQRKSELDPLLAVILEKYDMGWSYGRILAYLQQKFGVKTTSRSTVFRKIKSWTQ